MVKSKASSAAKPQASKSSEAASSKGRTRTHGQPATSRPGGSRAEDAPTANGHSTSPTPAAAEAEGFPALASAKNSSGVDLTEKVKELLRLAQEQGYLTYNDIN